MGKLGRNGQCEIGGRMSMSQRQWVTMGRQCLLDIVGQPGVGMQSTGRACRRPGGAQAGSNLGMEETVGPEILPQLWSFW